MKKKAVIITAFIVVLFLVITGVLLIINKENYKENSKEILTTFISLIENKEYEKMYNIISKDAKAQISQEDFITRNKNIYEGIDAVNINIEIEDIVKEDGVIKVTYNENMMTSAGSISFSNTAKIVKEEKEYKINWTSSMIFPGLRSTDKVRVSTLQSKRGEIFDRNGNKLAYNGTISNVGIVPRKIRRK